MNTKKKDLRTVVTTVKLSDAVTISGELNSLASEKLLFSVKFRIRNILNSFKGPLENLKTTQKELLNSFIVEDENGQRTIPKNKIEEYNDAFGKVLEEDVTITGRLDLSVLESVESVSKYLQIYDIIEDDSDQDK